MIVKFHTIVSLATLLIIFSCNQNQQQRSHSFAPKVVEARGYLVPKDSMEEPKVIPAGKPTVVRVGEPTVVSINTNVRPAGIPKVVIAGVPKVCTPGQDSFSRSKKVPAIDRPFVAGIPEVVVSKEAYTKDPNPQNFSSFGKLQGLRSATILCMLEDTIGNLWIGTPDGVSKYDGKSFTHFTAKEGLSSSIVGSLLQDKRGNLWFGTGTAGVSRYDGKRFTHFTVKEGLGHNWVSSILEDTRGHIWFGHNGGGVSQYDGKSFTHFTEKEGLSDNHVSSIAEDKNGHLWFGTGRGVSRYDGESFSHFTEKEGLNNNNIRCILKDKDGDLWFGSWGGGVSRFDGRNFTHFTIKEGLSSNSIHTIKLDKNGNLWFGTWGGGISKYDPGKSGTGIGSFTHFTEKEGLSNNDVRSVVVDKRGNLWFGTAGGGVNKYGGKRFTHFTVKDGLGDNYVESMLRDRRGNLWFGTNRGVSRYDGRSFTNFTDKEGFHFVWKMLEDKNGNLWFASFWGIGKYDGEKFTRIAGKEIDVKCMLEDKNGHLWFGTHSEGVWKYDGEKFMHFTEKQGLIDNKVRGIGEDRNGSLWFGTFGGLSKYNPAEGEKNFTNFTEKEGLNNNNISCILKDTVGNLWFGTWGGGISKYDGKNFTHFTEKEGLSNNDVKSILEDTIGNVWFGTAFGLSKLEKDKLSSLTQATAKEAVFTLDDRGPLFKTYTYEDGFSGIAVNWGNTLCEAGDGTIWIGTNDRVTAFHPGEDTPDTIPPNIQLTGLSLFNESIAWRNLEKEIDTSIVLDNGVSFHDFHFDSISKWYGIPEHLSLAYNNNFLAFQFLGITVQSPKKVKYRFKLEGLDKNWSALTSRTEASYGNLPHGKYTFKVKAMNGDGYWSKEFTYPFTIRPPWWQTWWAYTLFALSFAGFIYSLFRSRLNKIRKQHEIKQKTAQLEMQALRAQMNPHFIFNCLSSINTFILENNKMQASEYLSKFSRLVRLILQNSQESFIPLDRELEALRLYLELESLRFEQKFDYKISMKDDVDTTMVKVPPLIIQPYAENAIWHGMMHKEENSHLEIELSIRENILFCKITDDGIGRKRAAEIKSKSSLTYKSMGMRITAERIAILQQQRQNNTFVSINDLVSSDGSPAGTEVLIKVPFSQ